MTYQHKNLAGGRWFSMPLVEQMANIGSEVGRAIGWKKKGDLNYAQLAADRALELIDLTLADSKNKNRLKEIARLREFWADYFYFDNDYKSTEKFWQEYFYAFNWAARAALFKEA